MGETVSILNGANLRMHRIVFCIVIIISVASHTSVSAYLEYYPAYRRSIEDTRSLRDNTNWDGDGIAEYNQLQNQQEEDSFQHISKKEEEDTTVPDVAPTAVQFDGRDSADVNNQEISEPNSADNAPSVLKAFLAPDNTDDIIFLAISAGFSVVALVSLISLFICWYKLHRNTKAAADVEYPAYGVTGPNKELSPTGDRRLAQSAQMYHYQHQKQQIIAMESRANNERRGSVSEADSDEENEEGDYTVYECPGLAAQTGEMEVKNPLFQDDPTPATAVQSTEDSTANGEKK